MPRAESAQIGFKTQWTPENPPIRKPSLWRWTATFLLLGTCCGCSLFSSAAFSTKEFVLDKTAGARNVLHSKTLHYLGDSELNYYKDVATQIDYTNVYNEEDNRAINTQPPRRIRHPREDEIVDITLADAIQRALANSDVIRDRGQFLSPGNVILNSPLQANSVYDPAIQETGILLGNRGVEAALADFDSNFTVNSLWGRNEQVQNNQFNAQGAQPGTTLSEDSANVSARIEKQMANGGVFSVNQTVNYSLNNVPLNQSQRLFGSFYSGNLQAQYRHPLLAGNGTEFNRIAGPLASNPLRVSGVNQGVVIARINNDISVADFEASIRNLLKDVEDLYWELALAYRSYDAEIVARNSNLKVWRTTKVKFELEGKQTQADEAQAREAYFDSRSRAEDALARIFATEGELRRLLGLSVNDGYIFRPIDEPTTAEFLPDWQLSLAEALSNRVELRRQKWTVKSLELQLKAAKSLVRPRLDFVSAYQVNMFGDHLFGQNDNDSFGTPQGLNSAAETLTQGDQTGWNLGLEFSMPFGFRTARSQVRNLELQLVKSRKVLSVQELEVSHELARAFQDLDRAYQTAQTNFNRRRAAELRVQAEQVKVDVGLGDAQSQNNVDLLLRAQISLAQAEVAYYNSLVAYNQAITAIHYRKGSLLEFNSVALAESGWDPQAYLLALRRSWARSHAIESDILRTTEPPEFVTGSEELHLLMPTEETSPLMNREEAPLMNQTPLQVAPVQGMPFFTEPETTPPVEELGPSPPLPIPIPVPQTPEESNESSGPSLGWKKRGTEKVRYPARRPELPLR